MYKLKGKFSDNLAQNICRLFHVLAQLLLTTSETKLDYYHPKVDVRVIERLRLRIYGNYKKIPEMLGFDGEYPGGHPRTNFGTGDTKLQKISSKAFHRKNYFT